MQVFFTAQAYITPGIGFSYYRSYHISWLLAIGAVCVLMGLWIRRMTKQTRRCILLIFCIVGLGLETLKLLALWRTDQIRWSDLPLDLCDLALFVYPIAILSECVLLKELIYCLHFPGACLALLFPNWNSLPPLNLFGILAFLMHGILFLIPICMLTAGDLHPNPKRLPRCLMCLLLTCIPISIVNQTLGTNFFFLRRPSRGSPLSWAANWLGNPGYLFIMPVLIGLIWTMLYLPVVKFSSIKKLLYTITNH